MLRDGECPRCYQGAGLCMLAAGYSETCSRSSMLRIESEDKRRARLVWAHLDAAGFRATPPLPTHGIGRWSVVVEGATRQEVFRALPPYLRQGIVFSTLDSKEGV